MARSEYGNPKLGDLQIGCSWIPTTPAKPNSVNQQGIHTNFQENQYAHHNSTSVERLCREFPGEAQYQNITVSYASENSIGSLANTWQSGGAGNSDVYHDTLSRFDIWPTNGESSSHLYGENLHMNEKFCINDGSGWANMLNESSFVELLALADKNAAMRNAGSNAHFASISNVSEPRLYAQQISRSIPILGNDVLDLNRWPREKFVAEMNMQDTLMPDGRSVPSLPWFDPNSPPMSVTDEASGKTGPSQFEPTTPAKTNQAGPIKDSAATQDLSTCDVPAGEQFQENHNFDKGGTEEVDFTKTPQVKPKRRKHRPKVVIQDQVKRTSKARQEKPSANPGPTPPKRKYVRRKGVNVEDQTKEIDLTKQASTPIDTPVAKRKYTRRKGVEKSEVNMAKEAVEAGGQNTSIKIGSCRRSLNFNSDAQVRDETVLQRQDREVMMEKNAHELAQSDIRATSIKVGPLHGDSWPNKPSGCAKGKCQIVFSDVTHDKEEITVRAMIFQDGKWMPRSDTFSSNSLLTPIGQGISLKRQHVGTSASEEPHIPNGTCTFHNPLPTRLSAADESESTFGMYFPAAHKSTQSVKGCDAATNQEYSAVRFEATDLQRSIPAFQSNQSAQQVFEDLMSLEPEKKVRKRKAKGSYQHDSSLLPEVLAKLPVTPCKTVKKTKAVQEIDLNTSCKVFGGDTFPTLASKKPTKRRTLVNPTTHSVYIHQEFASTSTGPALRWMSLVDSIADQLNQLSLNSEVRHISLQNQQYGALVPYQRGGAVVLYDEKVKKRKARAKVDLDDETSRVWRLLLENIDSDGIDGTDEEKMKYWEEERRVFTGRAQSFIARMHLIQGDRRFSPWKGSVVDSVVGVFLTQNVSDHLSSSAFMSMASRFPPKPMTNPTEIHEAGVSNIMKEPLIFLFDSDETLESSKVLFKPVYGKDEVSHKDIVDEQIIVKAAKCVESASNKSTSLNVDEPDADEAISSQTSVITSHNSPESQIADKIESTESCSPSNSEEELATVPVPDNLTESISFLKLLKMTGKKRLVEHLHVESERLVLNSQAGDLLCNPTLHSKTNMSPTNSALCMSFDSGEPCSLCTNSGKELTATETSGLSVEASAHKLHSGNSVESASETAVCSNELHESTCDNSNINPLPKIAEKQMDQVPDIGIYPQNLMDVTSSSSNIDNSRKFEHNEMKSKKNDARFYSGETSNTPKSKGARKGKEKVKVDWDALRKEAQKDGKKERTINQMDSLDWEAVRSADVKEIANAIKERGMNNVLAERIQAFLERLVEDHESIDLEWLRDVEPDKAKEFLLSFRGLGLKSVECVRLLTLHHLAFPVDTNVARIAVRLGWAPLQPLPESLQLHLLELYPIMESIQKYLWPRLCKLDQKTLYELHYQMITFGKVFCTKSKPNCNACPMRGECRHFASAFASARFALPAPEDKSIVSATEKKAVIPDATRIVNLLELPSPQLEFMHMNSGVSSNTSLIIEQPKTPEPIIEVPATPEPECTQGDIEDAFYEDPDEIPTIHLNMEEFTQNLQTVMQQHSELQEGSLSRALVALTPEAASIPVPKLKNVSRLRTEHQVYQLPDNHPLLEGWDRREPDDPFPYLLAIWTPGETADSIAPPERRCSINPNDSESLCSNEACLYCNSIRESKSKTVRGTLLIPCRTAMKGSFPLNGTYFQVNEVFSDHESSLEPIEVPRQWLWNLQRRTVHFGTSIPTIFKGQTTEQIQNCFWRGFVCVRGFDRKSRAPRPLMARLHFHKTTKAEKAAPANKTGKGKGKGKTNANQI